MDKKSISMIVKKSVIPRLYSHLDGLIVNPRNQILDPFFQFVFSSFPFALSLGSKTAKEWKITQEKGDEVERFG